MDGNESLDPSFASSPSSMVHAAMYSSAGRRDPYRFLDPLHTNGTAARLDSGITAVWSYSGCTGVSSSSCFRKSNPFIGPGNVTAFHQHLTEEQRAQLLPDVESEMPPFLSSLDPPDHTRLRRLIHRAFAPARIETMRVLVEQIVDSLLNDLQAASEADFVEGFATSLPAQVIGAFVGLPIEDRRWFARLTAWQFRALDPSASFETLLEAKRRRKDMGDYVASLIRDRRRAPRDDLASALIRIESEGDRLSEPELIALVTMLYQASYETTKTMLTTGMFLLLTHPEQLERLRNDPSLARRANEEILRIDAPLVYTTYYAAEDTEAAGVPLAAGDAAILLLGAANRDPHIYAGPTVFDISRKGPPSLSFGFGPHLCLGATLARLEGEVALRAIVERFGRIELLEPDPPRTGMSMFREFESLRVRVSQ